VKRVYVYVWGWVGRWEGVWGGRGRVEERIEIVRREEKEERMFDN